MSPESGLYHPEAAKAWADPSWMKLGSNPNSAFGNYMTLAKRQLSAAVFFISEIQVILNLRRLFLGLSEKLKEQRHFRLKISPYRESSSVLIADHSRKRE